MTKGSKQQPLALKAKKDLNVVKEFRDFTKEYGSVPSQQMPLGDQMQEILKRVPAVSGLEDIRLALRTHPTITVKFKKKIHKFLADFSKGRPLSRKWGRFASAYRHRTKPQLGSAVAGALASMPWNGNNAKMDFDLDLDKGLSVQFGAIPYIPTKLADGKTCIGLTPRP